MSKLDWTHKNVKITDIRKLDELYLISIDDTSVEGSLKIKDKIFEKRLEPFFLKQSPSVSRDEILSVSWNMYLTKGHFVKITDDGRVLEHQRDADPDGWYVSYLEIAGPLGSFQTVIKKS
jgi:hypothetical protein